MTVNPIYKFTKCPPNLVTSFYDKEEEVSDDIITEISEKDPANDSQEKNKNLEKVISKNENTPKPNIATNKPENVAKVDKNINQTKIVSKTVENKITSNKPVVDNKTAVNKSAVNKPTVENNIPVNKPAVENKTSVDKAVLPNKPAVENKIPVNNPTANSKTAVNNAATVNKSAVKPAVDNKTAVINPTIENKTNKATVENKTAVNKATVGNKKLVNMPAVANKTAVTKQPIENKVVTKPTQTNSKNNDTVKKPSSSPVKPQIKITDAKVGTVTTQNKLEKKTDKVESDYDELDDHDILALMSEGIILDECSGSDDE